MMRASQIVLALCLAVLAAGCKNGFKVDRGGGTSPAMVACENFAATGKSKSDQFVVISTKMVNVGENYPVKIVVFKADNSNVRPVSVILGRGNDPDAEVPLFKQICVDQKVEAEGDALKGDISVGTKPGDRIDFAFNLNNFNHTHWKAKTPDSIWMVRKLCSVDQEPSPADWPVSPKVVTPSGSTAENINFSLPGAPAPPSTPTTNAPPAICYQYALHLDQKDSKVGDAVDIGIDPQVINHPN